MKNFVNISIKGFAGISILVFCYAIYRAEINFAGHDRSLIYFKYLKYIIISIFFSFFFILSLRFKEEIKSNIVVFFYSLVFILYLIELILLFDFNYFSQTKPKFVKDLNTEKNQKKYLSKIKNLIDNDVYPFSGYEIFLEENQKIYPMGYLSNTNTLLCRKNGKDLFYKSDKHGFRNSNDIWEKEVYDYVFIGDSFVHGSCVKDSDTMSNLLMKKTKKNVLNLGIGGFGPLTEYAVFLEFAEEKKPKKVYWFFYEGNDLTKDIRYEKKIDILMDYFLNDKTQDLINKQDLIDSYIKKKIVEKIILKEESLKVKKNTNQNIILSNINEFLHSTKFLRLWALRTLIKNLFVKETIDPIFKEILEKTNKKVKGWNGKMYFIYLPEETRYRNNFNFDNFRNKKDIIKIAKDLNIIVIDMDDKVFRKKDNPLDLFNNHYSEEGYNLIVNEILKTN